jgi:hypothetical protein
MVVQPCGRGRVKNRPAWRGGGVALTVIRHNCCSSQQQHSTSIDPSWPRGGGLSGVRSSSLSGYRRAEQISLRTCHSRQKARMGWDGMGWSGIGCDGDHDIFAVALMRTWVSKVSAQFRYSASSAVQAVQAVQTGLDLEAFTNLMKQTLLHDPRSTNNTCPRRGRAGWGGSRSWSSILTYSVRTSQSQPAIYCPWPALAKRCSTAAAILQHSSCGQDARVPPSGKDRHSSGTTRS